MTQMQSLAWLALAWAREVWITLLLFTQQGKMKDEKHETQLNCSAMNPFTADIAIDAATCKSDTLTRKTASASEIPTAMEEPCPRTHAEQHVFNIPELLESILIHLGPYDLLHSQRTSRSFRQTVQGSVRLRRKLFLEPDWTFQSPVSDAYVARSSQDSRPDNNRLLLRAFPGCYPTMSLVVVADAFAHARVPAHASTALQQLAFAQGARGNAHATPAAAAAAKEAWSWDVCISFPAENEPVRCEAVRRPEASWRRMYLCQPPCRALHLVRRWKRSLEPAVVRETGITMGDFYDEVTRATPCCGGRDWHESYISSDRDWHFEGNVLSNSPAT